MRGAAHPRKHLQAKQGISAPPSLWGPHRKDNKDTSRAQPLPTAFVASVTFPPPLFPSHIPLQHQALNRFLRDVQMQICRTGLHFPQVSQPLTSRVSSRNSQNVRLLHSSRKATSHPLKCLLCSAGAEGCVEVSECAKRTSGNG